MKTRDIYKKIFIHFLIVLLVIIMCKYFLSYVISLLFPFILAYIIAKVANPIVKFLEKRIRIKRKHSSIFIIGGVLSLIILAIYYLIKTLISFIMGLVDNVSVITNSISDISNKILELINKTKMDSSIADTVDMISAKLSNIVEFLAGFIIEHTADVISFIPLFFIVFFVTILSAYFMIKEDFTIGLSCFEKNEKFKLIKNEIIDVVINYLKGQFKIMFYIFIILCIGFGLMRLEYFILIALLVSFVDLLPILGTGTILYPWIGLSLFYGDYQKALFLFIIYIVAFIARQLLQPKIISSSIGLEPLPTLFFMFIGFKIWGLTGLILAPPIGMILIKIYSLGVFDFYKDCIVFIYNDLKQRLKIDFKGEKK